MASRKKKENRPTVVDVSPSSSDDWSSDEEKKVSFSPKTGKTTARLNRQGEVVQLLDTLIKNGVAVSGNVSNEGCVTFKFRSSLAKGTTEALGREHVNAQNLIAPRGSSREPLEMYHDPGYPPPYTDRVRHGSHSGNSVSSFVRSKKHKKSRSGWLW